MIAAWKLGPIPGLSGYHLHVTWTLYFGFQKDVSLIPPRVQKIGHVTEKDPTPPQAGEFRLVKAPVYRNLPAGWYSVLAQAFLKGGKCPHAGCTGQIRQNRFQVRSNH